MRKLLTLALIMGATVAVAQSEQDRAYALILPMLQEIQPGRAGEVLATCVVQSATPDELASLAAAPAPSAEVGQVINATLSRPETMQCLQAAAQ